MSKDDMIYECICGREIDEGQDICFECKKVFCEGCRHWSAQGCMLPDGCEYKDE